MKERSIVSIPAIALSLFGAAACAGVQSDAGDPGTDPVERWQGMRFGMFIHWGPVSLKGTEIGWSRGNPIPRAEYDALYQQFDPVEFDAEEWVRIAKDAGMKYMVLTSKHHDGFCLWDTKQTDHDIMHTPFGRDVIAELSAACRKEGLAFGLYYSILDWYQPDYNTAGVYGGAGTSLRPGQEPSMDRYQDYVHAQISELVGGYGPLFTLWFDGEWEAPWTFERGLRLAEHCRALDPRMLINNRVGKARQGMAGTTAQDSANPGDYDTPEQSIGGFSRERPWETCMTICRQWAWKPDDEMKSFEQCIRTLVATAGGDGNLLFNVGPMPDGRIEPRQAERLAEMGAWLREHGESIYGTRGGPFYPGPWGASTHRGDTAYVHVFDWGDGGELVLPGLSQRILSASILGGGEASFVQEEGRTTLSVPAAQRDPVDTIVVLELDAPASTMAEPFALRWEAEPGRSLALLADDRVLWRHQHASEQPHCFFHPLALPDTPPLTRDAPADHVWHHGLWFSWKLIDGVNYWEHAPGSERPAGRTRWKEPRIETRPDHSARIRLELEYAPGEDEAVLREERTLEIGAPARDGSYAIEWEGRFTALAERVLLDRTPLPHEPGGKAWGGYAGLSLRLESLEERQAVTEEGVVEFNAQDRYRGRHRAFEYQGKLDGHELGICVLDDHGNPRAPSPWYAIRSPEMTFFTPALLCYDPLELRRGQSLTLRYRILVHPDRWDAERLRELLAEEE